MKKRYIILLIIIIPTIAIAILHYFGIVDISVLYGYMVAVALVFKASLVSFMLASKLKIIAFIKSLTLVQALLLGVKRFIIDNMLSKWLQKYVFKYFKRPFVEIYGYLKNRSLKSKMKNILFFILPTALFLWVMYITDLLGAVTFYVELKMIVIGFFKAMWVLFGKVFAFVPALFSYLSNSWLGPIIEVFALSWLLDLIEKLFGKDNPLSKMLNYIGKKLRRFLNYIGLLNDKHLEPIFYNNVATHSKKAANKLTKYIQNKKIELEYIYFEKLKQTILKGHIDSYHSFDGMEKIKDKKELYNLINKKTSDGIDIVAFVSRDEDGNLINEEFENSFYHDIFILEGIASSSKYGVKVELQEHIDYSDFWVLNTSSYPVTISSNAFKTQQIDGNDLVLIKSEKELDFAKNVSFSYKNKTINATDIEQVAIGG